MDFDTEQYLMLPDAVSKDSDRIKFNSYISDKTRRDMLFYQADNDYYYEDTRWK